MLPNYLSLMNYWVNPKFNGIVKNQVKFIDQYLFIKILKLKKI